MSEYIKCAPECVGDRMHAGWMELLGIRYARAPEIRRIARKRHAHEVVYALRSNLDLGVVLQNAVEFCASIDIGPECIQDGLR